MEAVGRESKEQVCCPSMVVPTLTSKKTAGDTASKLAGAENSADLIAETKANEANQ